MKKKYTPIEIDLSKHERPKVLFIGNGCYYNPDFDWNEVIFNYVGHPMVKGLSKHVPNTIKVLPADINEISHKERLKRAFKNYQYLNNDKLMELIDKGGFDTILTTNYTYDIECELDDKFLNIVDKTKKYARSSASRLDQKYLIKTHNVIEKCFKDARTMHIWHIHGELRNSNSIILSHDAYGSLTGKITQYIDESHSNYVSNNIKFDSWIDYFVFADIYIIGFGYDYSEFDLWWLLNKRFRTNNRGKMVFYQLPTDEIKIERLNLISQFDVKTKSLGYASGSKDYSSFYLDVYKDILKEISL